MAVELEFQTVIKATLHYFKYYLSRLLSCYVINFDNELVRKLKIGPKNDIGYTLTDSDKSSWFFVLCR